MPGAPSATSCAFANVARHPRTSRKAQSVRERPEESAHVPKGAGRSRRRRKMQGARKRREAAADSTTS